jgi:superfamily II DNA or RNA helicase
MPDARVGFYIGKMKERELAVTEDSCNIILGTYAMAAEGMDIPKLDTLILASPKGNVEQAIGRVQRKRPEDRLYEPLVIDIVDDFSVFSGQYKKRHTYYKKMKYDITSNRVTVEKDNKKEAPCLVYDEEGLLTDSLVNCEIATN